MAAQQTKTHDTDDSITVAQALQECRLNAECLLLEPDWPGDPIPMLLH